MSEGVMHVYVVCIYTLYPWNMCVCVFPSGNTRLQQFIRQLVSSTRDKQLVLLYIDLGEMLLPVEISVCLSVCLSACLFLSPSHICMLDITGIDTFFSLF